MKKRELESKVEKLEGKVEGLEKSLQLLKMEIKYSTAPWKRDFEEIPRDTPVVVIRLDRKYFAVEEFYDGFYYNHEFEKAIACGLMAGNWLFAWREVCTKPKKKG